MFRQILRPNSFLSRKHCRNCVSDNCLQDLVAIWPGKYRMGINHVVREIATDESYQIQAKSKYIDNRTWSDFTAHFRRKLVKEPLKIFPDATELQKFCRMLDGTFGSDDVWFSDKIDESKLNQCKEYLFDVVLKEAEAELHEVIAAYKTLCSSSDLRIPHEWYPPARLMRRKIVYHGGPTNSGKTHTALLRLQNADKAKGGGLYCGPLRLLALEIYDRLNREGVYTSLLTGQEKREVPFSTHISCTVEMVSLDKEYDVAVIDEIQMIADPQRGYAWTRALQGLRAKEIHVCGGLEAYEIVRSLVESTNDEFELRTYERLSQLKVADKSLEGDYSKVQPGDCIVAFSRADIFSIRRQIERLTPYKCAVIYGQLPPETRSTQARLFNEENTGYDILVASDAIGMGLNLNIRRIIFHTTVKRGSSIATSPYFVDPSNVKQIGGRAGRKSSKYKFGEVTTWQEADLAYVRAVMSWDIPQVPMAGIFPSVEQVQLFSEQLKRMETEESSKRLSFRESKKVVTDNDSAKAMVSQQNETSLVSPSSSACSTPTSTTPSPPTSSASSVLGEAIDTTTRLATLLSRFVDLAQMDGRYFLCEHSNMVMVANWLHSIPLSLPERFIFANAPVNIRDTTSMNLLYQFAACYALKRPVALNVRMNRRLPRDVLELADLCSKHNILDLYLWLSLRFPKYFVERDLCLEQKNFAISAIESTLDMSSLHQKYSHSEEYQKVRSKIQAVAPDGLPPHSFGEVREKTRELTELTKSGGFPLFHFPLQKEEEDSFSGKGGKTSAASQEVSHGGNRYSSSGRKPRIQSSRGRPREESRTRPGADSGKLGSEISTSLQQSL